MGLAITFISFDDAWNCGHGVVVCIVSKKWRGEGRWGEGFMASKAGSTALQHL